MSKNTQLGNLVNGIYVDSTGKVGVGTQSPSVALDVVGAGKFSSSLTATSAILSGGGETLRVYGTNPYISWWDSANTGRYGYIQASSGLINFVTDSSVALNFSVSGSDRMRITSAGNVGIGTSSPGSLLDVQGGTNSGFTAAIMANSTFAFGSTNGRRLVVLTSTQGDKNGLQIGYDSTAGTGIIAASTESAGAGLDFYTYNGSAWASRMRILSNGNIGIGGASSDGAASDDKVLTIHNPNSTGSMRSMIRFTNYNSGTAWGNGAFLTTDSSNNFYVSNLEANDIIFQTNGTARLYLTGDGKMSIPYTTLAYTGNMTMYWNNSTGVVGVLTSSRRFKKDIVSLTSEQAKIALLLNPVEYTRLETNEREYGFIAEEVKEAGLGLLVPEMDGSPITVDYARISVIAIAMIKEQEKAIQELKAEIDILKNK